jgi:hypothetical protein
MPTGLSRARGQPQGSELIEPAVRRFSLLPQSGPVPGGKKKAAEAFTGKLSFETTTAGAAAPVLQDVVKVMMQRLSVVGVL